MAIITITRGAQSGGRKLAHRLAEKLGYSCLSREVVTTCARKYNIPEKDLYDKLIEAPSRWRKLSKEHTRYLTYIQCSLIDAAMQDNVIYHGYAGQLFLRGVSHALKVRLEAPLSDRVRAEMQEYHKDYEEALEYIKKVDAQRDRWVKFLYGEDWHDPSLYDLSINLKSISTDAACEMIALVIGSDQYKTTEKSLRRLHDLSLECEVKAAIVSDDKIWDQAISVDAYNSVVTLRGTVKNKKTRDAIVDAASKVKNVADCKVEISLSKEREIYGYGHD